MTRMGGIASLLSAAPSVACIVLHKEPHRMFSQLKPGHVLEFSIDPGSIISPAGVGNDNLNDNTLETKWSTTKSLGAVKAISHPSGPIGNIAVDVASRLRGASKLSRSISYSQIGRALGTPNQAVGVLTCDFVGYVDGRSNYIDSNITVLSKDFSGCLMVSYNLNGHRRIAHAASSQVPKMDCKQAFLTRLQGSHATLNGWFQPFNAARDAGRKADAFAVVKNYIQMQINNLVTFGVMGANNTAFSFDAFKPHGITGNKWVVTDVTPHTLNHTFIYP